MRAVIIATTAAMLLTAAGAGAQECRFGNNRPAIDTMDRNITPGGTVIACTQRTLTVTTPSGARRDMKMWAFQKAK